MSQCNASKSSCCAGTASPADDGCPLTYFENMISHCYEYAVAQKKAGRPIVGIMCEYTPRELILAAGAVPVCLCGGAAETIPAAEEELPANLCPLIKSTYGYHVQKSNPFLEMADLLVAETTCDGKKKMFELLARTRPMHVLELPQKQDDPDALAHWKAELRKLKDELERRFNTTITRDALREAIQQMNEERHLRRELAEMMTAERPPLTGKEMLSLKSSISCIPSDFAQYKKARDMLHDSGRFADGPRKVRVLLTGVPQPHGAERVLEIVESSGGLVVCMENCTGVKPLLEDVHVNGGGVDELLVAIAEKYYHLPCSVMTTNQRRMDSLRSLAAKYRPDCVIELIWQACLTYDVESHSVRELAEKELHLPYLRIETDYSPSDSARIAVRVEALLETARQGGAAKDA